MTTLLFARPETYYFVTWVALVIVAHCVGRRVPMSGPGTDGLREFNWKWLLPVSREVHTLGAVGPKTRWPGRQLLDSCGARYDALLKQAMPKLRR